MNKDQNEKSTQDQNNENAQSTPKNRLRVTTIAVEVDLENREIFFKDDLMRKLKLELPTNDVYRVISNYVDPRDLEKVNEGLSKAKEGQENPIRFRFVHPLTAEKLCMEYRYEIIYVKYASTRLNGVLVNLKETQVQ